MGSGHIEGIENGLLMVGFWDRAVQVECILLNSGQSEHIEIGLDLSMSSWLDWLGRNALSW